MAFDLGSVINGLSDTGFTSPSYSLTEDTPPNGHSKQYAVHTIGGTVPAGLLEHSASSPFTLTMERPAQFKQLGAANPGTGIISSVPRNVYTLRIRKGVEVGTYNPTVVAMADCKFSIPAGADLEDTKSIRAILSCLGGLLVTKSSDIADTLVSGIL